MRLPACGFGDLGNGGALRPAQYGEHLLLFGALPPRARTGDARCGRRQGDQAAERGDGVQYVGAAASLVILGGHHLLGGVAEAGE